MRRISRLLATAAALALLAAACGNDDDADTTTDDTAVDDTATDETTDDDATDDVTDDDVTDEEATEVPDDGPTIDVSSFNFPESEILGEIYAQALEDAGYPVDRTLNLGARELIYPELLDGEISLVPEYLGSALVVWFEQDPPQDVDSGLESLREAFDPEGVSVLEPAPAENNQAFVVTSEFAEENGLSSLADLADAGDVTFAGPPECEGRDTCYQGLVDIYGLDNVSFESIQEAAARLAAVEAGDAQMILLFSTDAPLAGDDLVVLEDTEGMLPPENITPVVRTEVLDAYGDDLSSLLDEVTAAITTDALQQMNAEASEGRSAEEIASDWLAENV
jgi:osmoprotectant transport system substrate-binding protein